MYKVLHLLLHSVGARNTVLSAIISVAELFFTEHCLALADMNQVHPHPLLHLAL